MAPAAPAPAPGPATPEWPDILLIVSDDHGYADLSLRGSPDARTPHLDRLAASGTIFENGYVSAPICSPSRAGLIAGAHQQRWGAHWFDTSAFPPASRPVLPEILGAAGYRTGYFGKVHYGPEGPGDRACPDRHGFDRSLYGLAGQSFGRLHYLHHSSEAVAEYGEAAAVHGVQPLYEDGRETSCARHLTTELAQRAIDFMGEGADADDADAGDAGAGEGAAGPRQPFFCMVAFNAVHNFAWQLPQDELEARSLPAHDDFDPETARYLDWYDGAISPHLVHGRAYYLAQLEIMDREIGRMLDHLEATGRRESTLVVYLTDNGGSTCNYGSNLPLEGTKYSLFEGGIRVPYIVSWPGTVPAGRTAQGLVSSLDLLPTFAAAASAPLPEGLVLDGRDLRPAWEDPGPEAGHPALFFDTGFQSAVRTPRWKLRRVDPDAPQRAHLLEVEHTDIGAGTTLVPIGESCDESAAADASARHPEVLAELHALHEAWRAEMAAG
ncbi:sulfatase family protein [Brachybacterium phenoliresistens]|uniref:sulfatase family protein n=1 Tax=Brachybacterium phenoliresistens TaxID=396014 RepID=UPI0031E38B04